MYQPIKHFLGGLMTALLCFAAGVLLHTCTAETVQAQEKPSRIRAAELAAQAEIMKLEADYEEMSTAEKMKGIVYE